MKSGFSVIRRMKSSDITIERLQIGIKQSLLKSFGEEAVDASPMIFAAKSDFGDYQSNAAMPLAKKLKMRPKDIAETIVNNLELSDVIASCDVSGPGFINLHLSDAYVRSRVFNMLQNPSRMGIAPVKEPLKIVVDFSSPNIAKEMHVGHLRSTIIGDSICRVFSFLGHDVKRLNHVGDWGTQFGMLIYYLKTNYPEASVFQKSSAAKSIELGVEIGDLVEFYKAAKKSFDESDSFKECSRNEVVKLQSGDSDSIRAWQAICAISRQEFQRIYDKLGVQLEERGESFYNPYLEGVVKVLRESGVAVESEGAQCVFLDGYKNSDGSSLPMIVQKSDGGYLYSTTDIAALQHRIVSEKADRIVYVTDAGQSQHFKMVFEVFKNAEKALLPEGIDASKVELTHVPFGLVLGEDGKKIKSRAGDSVKLRELLDEAIRLAEEEIMARNASNEDGEEGGKIDLSELREASRVIGIGAVKYADLSMNRESNYKFSFKKMLSLSGNTAPYMLYAFVRIEGIKRKALKNFANGTANDFDQILLDRLASGSFSSDSILLGTLEESSLAKHLIKLDEVLLEVSKDLYPNRISEYLFELSQKFNQFYERCPVLKAGSPELQLSRTVLCSLTSGTLKLCLELLGIGTLEKL